MQHRRRYTVVLALALLAGCFDATTQWLITPEGRAACASAGGRTGSLNREGQVRCYRMIRIDTTRAVEDTTGGGR